MEVQSQFIEMFGNPLSDVQKYGLKKLGDCCELNPRRPRLNLEDSDMVSFVPMPSVSENGHLVDVADEEYGKVKALLYKSCIAVHQVDDVGMVLGVLVL